MMQINFCGDWAGKVSGLRHAKQVAELLRNWWLKQIFVSQVGPISLPISLTQNKMVSFSSDAMNQWLVLWCPVSICIFTKKSAKCPSKMGFWCCLPTLPPRFGVPWLRLREVWLCRNHNLTLGYTGKVVAFTIYRQVQYFGGNRSD